MVLPAIGSSSSEVAPNTRLLVTAAQFNSINLAGHVAGLEVVVAGPQGECEWDETHHPAQKKNSTTIGPAMTTQGPTSQAIRCLRDAGFSSYGISASLPSPPSSARRIPSRVVRLDSDSEGAVHPNRLRHRPVGLPRKKLGLESARASEFLLRVSPGMSKAQSQRRPAAAPAPPPLDHDRPDQDRPDQDAPDHDLPDHDSPDQV